MGRRSINTTKSGKFMNPTDQARKEARKRELKKNKKQRMLVRAAVLKGKDPLQLIDDMHAIDDMEFDPTQPSRLNEKVLKDKRRKLIETLERVLTLYEKEDPGYYSELKKAYDDYEKGRLKKQIYYEQVKTAERVELAEIPLPDGPTAPALPSDIPLPMDMQAPPSDKPLQSILKKQVDVIPKLLLHTRKPPAPPMGAPPDLSDSENEEYDPEKAIEENLDLELEHGRSLVTGDDVPPAKQRKIRFHDDNERDSDEDEKDTRPKLKPAVSALQVKMLQIAGQEVPMVQEPGLAAPPKKLREDQLSSEKQSDDPSEEVPEEAKSDGPAVAGAVTAKGVKIPGPPPGLPPGVPPGPPAGLPPGPPSGLPPALGFAPPPLRPGAPRLLPPGPPPGRPPGIVPPPSGIQPPHGLPPGPPPGLPPRLPPGPPMGVRPRILLPPGVSAPPGVPAPPGVAVPLRAKANPNVLSAPPSIMRPGQKGDVSTDDVPNPEGHSKQEGATISAKPQIKHVIGDVTRFMPTALKVKRTVKDSRGRVIKTNTGKEDVLSARPTAQAVPTQMKGDAYELFMKEMQDFI